MRSLYARILFASLGTILLALAGFVGVFVTVSNPSLATAFRGFEAVMAQDVAEAFERGGAPLATEYLKRYDRTTADMEHFLVDGTGHDVVTGQDRSALLTRRDEQGRAVLITASVGGRYRMITAAVRPFGLADFLPYLLLILSAIAFVCWLLALGIASPVREMVAVVNDFGRGRFTARAKTTRRDEIGDLARSFNEMANRIETLVSAERRLLQDVSHELRSPLTRLNLAIELSRAAPNHQAAADRLQREADRLSYLVGALLEVTRLDTATVATPEGRVDVAALVREVATDCELEAQSRDCRVVFETDSAAEISGDPEVLRRALENVLRNAIRYAPPGTLVEVRCEDAGSDLRVSIRDFGPGVPAESLPQLGNAFYRVDPSRDPGTGGLGLGIAIAQRAIQLHRGTWSAENAQPGLRVVMTIPHAQAAA